LRELAVLRPPLGDVGVADALALADAVEASGAVMRLGLGHEVRLYGRGEAALPERVAAWADAPEVVSCPGRAWCERGVADSRKAGGAIREALGAGCGVRVCVSGCPNGCSHAGVSDIGLVGRVRTVAGERVECFRLTAGGDGGRGPGLGVELYGAVPAEKAAEAVRLLADEFEAGGGGRSFAEFVAAEGQGLSGEIEAMLAEG
jgi:sulfite reductase beta subunit-like hemoprotein